MQHEVLPQILRHLGVRVQRCAEEAAVRATALFGQVAEHPQTQDRLVRRFGRLGRLFEVGVPEQTRDACAPLARHAVDGLFEAIEFFLQFRGGRLPLFVVDRLFFLGLYGGGDVIAHFQHGGQPFRPLRPQLIGICVGPFPFGRRELHHDELGFIDATITAA